MRGGPFVRGDRDGQVPADIGLAQAERFAEASDRIEYVEFLALNIDLVPIMRTQ